MGPGLPAGQRHRQAAGLGRGPRDVGVHPRAHAAPLARCRCLQGGSDQARPPQCPGKQHMQHPRPAGVRTTPEATGDRTKGTVFSQASRRREHSGAPPLPGLPRHPATPGVRSGRGCRQPHFTPGKLSAARDSPHMGPPGWRQQPGLCPPRPPPTSPPLPGPLRAPQCPPPMGLQPHTWWPGPAFSQPETKGGTASAGAEAAGSPGAGSSAEPQGPLIIEDDTEVHKGPLPS